MAKTILEKLSKGKSRAFKREFAKGLIWASTVIFPIIYSPHFLFGGAEERARRIDPVTIYETALLNCKEEQKDNLRNYTKKNITYIERMDKNAENLIALQNLFFPEVKTAETNKVEGLEEKITQHGEVVNVGKEIYFSQDNLGDNIERVLNTDLILAINGGGLYRLNKGTQKVEKMMTGVGDCVSTPKEFYLIRNGETFMINSNGVVNKVNEKSVGTEVKRINNTEYRVLFGQGKPLVIGEDSSLEKSLAQKECEAVVKLSGTKRIFYEKGDFYALSNEILFRSGINGSLSTVVGPASDFIIKDIDGDGQSDLVLLREKAVEVLLNGRTNSYEIAHNFAPGTWITNHSNKDSYRWLLPNKLIRDVKKQCEQ